MKRKYHSVELSPTTFGDTESYRVIASLVSEFSKTNPYDAHKIMRGISKYNTAMNKIIGMSKVYSDVGMMDFMVNLIKNYYSNSIMKPYYPEKINRGIQYMLVSKFRNTLDSLKE